ncbi:MAG TPA: DNA-formamidopyrimidine glycosylase family protein [Byssovorax sp.]
MPEYPDVTVYVAAVAERAVGQPLERLRLASPFVLRTVDPSPQALAGKRVVAVRRVGKRIAIGVEGDLWAVVHLMIAGRFHWKEPGAKIPGRVGLLAFDFPTGSLTLTEASKKKRASLHVVRGEAAVRALDRGGVEPMEASKAGFEEALRRENHTLKRSLTDPRLFGGIGNAYSDEILHAAKLSPVRLTHQMSADEVTRLFDATRATLELWTKRLMKEAEQGFPEHVTAFRPEMAVHGKYGKPCPVCGDPVQRIVHAENETNYCATCQTGGKLLADRSLSRLLKTDWPKTLEELEERKATFGAPDAVVHGAPAAQPAKKRPAKRPTKPTG